jgi:DNA sulfur modification protein DndD
MVQILELTIKDYRQYEGTNTIDLRMGKNKNINIIEGQNGAGKSNILNAITLCFYDEEVHQESTGDDLETLPYISESILEELSNGESARGYIEVKLGEQKPDYIFRREFETFKVPNGHNDQTQDLELQRRSGNQYDIVDDPQTTLNQLLPAGVRDYFMFDGEALTEFFEGGYKQRVKDGIIDVSHIGVLNSGIDHVETIRKEIQGKASNLQGEASKIQERIETLEAELDTLESRKASLETEKGEVEQEIARIEEKLRGATDERVQELVRRRDDLRNELDDLQTDIEKNKSKICEQLKTAGPAIFTTDALEFTLKELNELQEKGQLPPKIQDWFIDELLEKGECICGRPIDEGSDTHEHLDSLRDTMSDVSTDNIEGKSEIPRIIRDGNTGAERIRDLRRERRELKNEVDDKDQELTEVKNKLKGTNIPDDVDVAELTTQLEELEAEKERLINKIGQETAKIETRESDIKKAEKQLEDELRKEDRHKTILEQTDFADDALSEMQEIKENILSQIREETEENLNEYFNDLIWKEDEYWITLDKDYSVEVKGPDSPDNRIGSLSAGEKQVLALSFMAALSDISGFTAPIVIDTPLGRISSEPKELIAQNLPAYLEDTQITFLMTDEEYTSTVQGLIQDRVANEYKLNYANGTTEVTAYE